MDETLIHQKVLKPAVVIPKKRKPRVAPVRLSKREHVTLQLLSEGFQTAEIAVRLFVTVDTIESHRKNILKKMNAKHMPHAIALGFRFGFIK